MADQSIMNEVIMKAMAEATRVAIQAMAETQAQRMPNTSGLKVGVLCWDNPALTEKWQTNTPSGRPSSSE